MPNPPAPLRDKIATALRALRTRPWGGKDIALLVVSLLLVAVSGYAFREPLGRFGPGAGGWGGDGVGVRRQRRPAEPAVCGHPVRPASRRGEGGPDPRSSSGDDRAGSRRVVEVEGHQRSPVSAEWRVSGGE